MKNKHAFPKAGLLHRLKRLPRRLRLGMRAFIHKHTPEYFPIAYKLALNITLLISAGMVILGLVENMGGFLCPHCGLRIDLFQSEGGRRLAEKEGIPLLANLPLEPDMVSLADQGRLTELYDSKLPFAEAFIAMVNKMVF